MPTEIAVFGLGYVGAVSAACFADSGHRVIGVDVNAEKVTRVNAGRTPVVEEYIGDMIDATVASGRLTATTDVAEAVAHTQLALVCVGTPSDGAGGLSTEYIERVAEQIGAAMAQTEHRYTVAIRSTMVPGTTASVVVPLLEHHSGKKAGRDFGVCVNPEFLREGTSVRDFYEPPKTVIGEIDSLSGDAIAALYEGLPGEAFRVPIKVAECIKYADNAFHAVKVAFANEIGVFCKALDLDSHEVMRIFKADTKLNISSAYLTPGFSFGGSCLPKDLRALVHAARHLDLTLPLLESVLPSNDQHIDRVYDLVANSGVRRVGLLGLSFKSGTDDLRESPLVTLSEKLLGRGFELLIWDDQVRLSALQGANQAYVESRIPHLSRLMASSVDAVVNHGELLVLGSGHPSVTEAIGRSGAEKRIIDLVRPDHLGDIALRAGYVGIGW